MSHVAERYARDQAGWDPQPIIDWLMARGRLITDIEELARQTCERMLASGAPVWRVRMSTRTLHPLIAAFTVLWEHEAGEVASHTATHGLEGRSSYIGSPMEIIGRTQQPFRKRLAEPLDADDHVVLHELKSAGVTDYFGYPARLAPDRWAVFIFNGKGESGFTEADLAGFERIANALAPLIDLHVTRRTAQAVAETYLGKRTGRLVLEGRITRGNIETMEAAIFVSDIRGWTEINRLHDPDEVVAIANAYFETMAEAIESHGGEILKFIGDGLMAVFPVDEAGASAACQRALQAALSVIEPKKRDDVAHDGGGSDLPTARFGVGLHFGTVLYGNVGSPDRLDFTILGDAVNLAARIEACCAELGRSLLFSSAFGGKLAEPTELVSRRRLKGVAEQVPLYTITGLGEGGVFPPDDEIPS